MRIDSASLRRFFPTPKVDNRITRIAINALMILNNCLITSMFFVASNIVTGIVLTISIVGSAVVIERVYGKNKSC